MPTHVTSALQRLSTAVRGFSLAQRTIALIGVGVLVLGIVALTSWLARPAYTPLFSGLEASDANTIVEQLRTDGVAYELADGGATILVPDAEVYDQRLKAASAGLPSSSTGGYSLLDDMGVTSSEFQQSVTYKRALEGELAATIGALTGVQTASVRLAIPEQTVFVSEKTDPTASVFVKTKNGVTLSGEQVQAIVHLTSASIDGMKPTDVAVIDAEGTVLSAVGVGASGSTDDRASDYEEGVRSAVQAMLDKVAGPGNATVVVAADINYESAERVEESFSSPEEALALNESTSSERQGGAGDTAAGVLGPDNIAVPDDVADGGGSVSEQTVRTNAVNKVTESRIIPAGAIDRQTISVALDAAGASGLDVAEVKALVAAAAGIDTIRGDEVTVEMVNFNQEGALEAADALAAEEKATANAQLGDFLRIAVITLGIVLTLVAGLIVYAKRSRRQEREAVDMGQLDEILNSATVPITMKMPPSLEHTGTSFDRELDDMDRKRSEIAAFADNDPEKTAEYLRSLMDDRVKV